MPEYLIYYPDYRQPFPITARDDAEARRIYAVFYGDTRRGDLNWKEHAPTRLEYHGDNGEARVVMEGEPAEWIRTHKP